MATAYQVRPWELTKKKKKTAAFRHHVDDVVHHRGAQLQIEVALHTLLCDGLGHPLRSMAVDGAMT